MSSKSNFSGLIVDLKDDHLKYQAKSINLRKRSRSKSIKGNKIANYKIIKFANIKNNEIIDNKIGKFIFKDLN